MQLVNFEIISKVSGSILVEKLTFYLSISNSSFLTNHHTTQKDPNSFYNT